MPSFQSNHVDSPCLRLIQASAPFSGRRVHHWPPPYIDWQSSRRKPGWHKFLKKTGKREAFIPPEVPWCHRASLHAPIIRAIMVCTRPRNRLQLMARLSSRPARCKSKNCFEKLRRQVVTAVPPSAQSSTRSAYHSFKKSDAPVHEWLVQTFGRVTCSENFRQTKCSNPIP